MNHLDAMQAFVRVAELSSFTHAADSLGLPKASASTAVRKLETSLGTQLLHRTTRRVHLTADGEAFYERCKDLLDDMDELRSMFQRAHALRGRLRVDMSSGLARHFVLPRLPEFLDQHPQLEIELSGTDRIVDVVREGFDCVLRVGTVEDSTLAARRLGALPVVTCASPAYVARFGTPKNWKTSMRIGWCITSRHSAHARRVSNIQMARAIARGPCKARSPSTAPKPTSAPASPDSA